MRRRDWFLCVLLAALSCGAAAAQSAPEAAAQAPGGTQSVGPEPNAPSAPGTTLQTRTSEEGKAARIAALATVNGRAYQRPTHREQFNDYLRDSYGLSGWTRTIVRSLYEEGTDHPSGWGQDFPAFMQRVGSNAAITAIDGSVRLGMETAFREDMRYIPCHGCSVKRKIMNALLAEVTARHDTDGHRFFTLTPAIADFSGPILANYAWYPSHDPFGGVVATRTVAATRVGQHLFVEFVWERRHRDRKIEDSEPLRTPPKPAQAGGANP